jgi:hypothetical protein
MIQNVAIWLFSAGAVGFSTCGRLAPLAWVFVADQSAD